MSKKEAKEFLKKINQDPDFKKSLQNAGKDEAKNIVQQHNLTFTQEELKEAYCEMQGRELNKEELAQISAGSIPGTGVSALSFDS